MAARQQECFICLGSFKNPKLISCHHSFCYKCLEDYVRINVRNHRFDCPMCKTNVKLPKGGVKDFQTDVHLDTNSGENFACDLCGPNSVACSRCLDCEENLCQSCCYVHEKLKVSKHHKISDLGTLDSVMKGNIRQRILCDQHQEEEIKLFCRDCNVLICVVCKAVNHQIHATKTVVDAAAEVKQILQTKMSFCSDKMRRILTSKEKGEELDRCIDDAEREDLKAVEDQRSQLNQVLDEEVAKVKVKTKTVYYKRRLQNAAFKRDMQNEIKTCSNAYENAKMLTGQGTDIEIIKKGPDLLQLISEAMSASERSPDTNLKNKLFSPAIIKKAELISMIGIIQDSTDSELFKKVRSILNKLTPQKFQTLVAKMQALEIDTEARLKGVIDLVFEKAISEPGFSVAYANMWRCLSMFKVPAERKQGDVTFRALLLTRCQQELKKANSLQKKFDSKSKEIEKATTEEQKQQMKEELEDEETKAKRRFLEYMRFIGELFKLKMLTENNMHDCVFNLLRTKDEENLECLCSLLKTIGKELDTDKAKLRMDQYFAQMQKIVNEKQLSSRVRNTMQDVIELRQGKWVPRRDDNNPETIDQIHQEVAQEAQDRAMFVQTLPQAKTQKGCRGRPEHTSRPMGAGADGWNMVSSALLGTDRTIDPTKLKLSKLGDSENIQLGPGGRAAGLGWFKGSTGGEARSQEGERPNASGNGFSALSKADKSDDDGSRRRGKGVGFGRPGPPANSSSEESEREKALAAANTIVGQRPFEERSSGREPERSKTVEKPSTPVPELTHDQMLSKTRAIMDEYLHIQDVAPYFNRSSMWPSGYKMSHPQPGQRLYALEQMLLMQPLHYSSTAQQVIMPMKDTNYPQRMSSPAYQNSMPTMKQGIFQLPRENTTNCTPNAHAHTFNKPPAVFDNAAQQQNRPPSASGMSGQGQPPAKKRERTVLQIIDPNSGKDIMQEIQQARGTPPSLGTLGSHSTASGQEISHTPQNEIAAQFAAQAAEVGLSTHTGGNQ